MPSFEEEALARARQMKRSQERRPPPGQPGLPEPEPPRDEPAPEPKPELNPPPKPAPANKGGVLELFFRDRERSLLMTLLLLLMDENSDPGLLLALVYMLL